MFNKRFVYMNLVIVLFVFQAAIGQKKVSHHRLLLTVWWMPEKCGVKTSSPMMILP
jgi:hypothetical protein